jgi:hypothetical protein
MPLLDVDDSQLSCHVYKVNSMVLRLFDERPTKVFQINKEPFMIELDCALI